MTDSRRVRVLLFESNPLDVRLLSEDLRRFGSVEFDLTVSQRLSEATYYIEHVPIDVIVLDLDLRDGGGLETLFRLQEVAPDIAVVVVTGLDDEAQALEALKNGAQDYLIKSQVDSHTLFRAIRYAIERKQTECRQRLLEQTLLQMQKLNAVGSLAGGVAHNFNNALTVVLGHCKLLLEKAEMDEGFRMPLESIKKAAQRAADLTHQLLIFSRKQPAEYETVDLNSLILEIRLLLEAPLNSEIDLDLNLAAEGMYMRADRGQIRQMLMNLVLNARNAMPNGGKITIETARRPLGDILLTVSDNGVGMSRETSSRIFEPFFTTKGLAEASGLGLSTVYGIVKQHDGTISVSSKPSRGTNFSIAFPSENCVDSEIQKLPTILVVQDENRPELEISDPGGLKRFTVLKACDWQEALELDRFHESEVDLLIADIVSPHLIKPQFVRQLVSRHQKMKIIYVSDSFAKTLAEVNAIPQGIHLPQTALTRENLTRIIENELLGCSRTPRKMGQC